MMCTYIQVGLKDINIKGIHNMISTKNLNQIWRFSQNNIDWNSSYSLSDVPLSLSSPFVSASSTSLPSSSWSMKWPTEQALIIEPSHVGYLHEINNDPLWRQTITIPGYEKPMSDKQKIEEPPAISVPDGSVYKKEAVRMIVIRRRKMKKHKLKKLRRKMKFEWAKVRQRREMRKEKEFQSKLLAQIKEAEQFDAEKFVTERLRKANEVPLPRHWKGRRLPAFIIKKKLGIE